MKTHSCVAMAERLRAVAEKLDNEDLDRAGLAAASQADQLTTQLERITEHMLARMPARLQPKKKKASKKKVVAQTEAA